MRIITTLAEKQILKMLTVQFKNLTLPPSKILYTHQVVEPLRAYSTETCTPISQEDIYITGEE